MNSWGMDEAMLQQILNGEVEDLHRLRLMYDGMIWSGRLGLWLLWIAAALTLITGADYLLKALPHLRETR